MATAQGRVVVTLKDSHKNVAQYPNRTCSPVFATRPATVDVNMLKQSDVEVGQFSADFFLILIPDIFYYVRFISMK